MNANDKRCTCWDEPGTLNCLVCSNIDMSVKSQSSCSASVARELIVFHVSPWEVIGDASWHDGEWRALVAFTPSGPLVLMAFKIKQ